MDLTVFDIRINDGYDAWDLASNRTPQTDQPGADAQDSAAGSVKVAYAALGPTTLTFIGTFANSHIRYSYDSDFGNPLLWAPVHLPVLGFAGARATHAQPGGTAGQYQLRARVNWLLGVYQLALSESLADTAPGSTPIRAIRPMIPQSLLSPTAIFIPPTPPSSVRWMARWVGAGTGTWARAPSATRPTTTI